MKLLLDTHAFIWWDDGKLPPPVVRRIQRADQVLPVLARILGVGVPGGGGEA